jgi:hydrogenase expression/formation protein HypD
MAIKHIEEYRDPQIALMLINKIKQTSHKPVRLMEVCGTHTMAIFRHGIRQVIPDHITLLSGPGCPVCVTTQKEIDTFIALTGLRNAIVATFGDLMRVPGSKSSLQNERASGKDIRMVYSTFDALEIARKNPDRKIIFLGVGFETTAPTVAASIVLAFNEKINNYFVYSSHKRVPPVLFALMEDKDIDIDGFILPGHVSVIIGTDAYHSLFEKYQFPCTVAGFEPVDILKAISSLVDQIESQHPMLDNTYERAVTSQGNIKAGNIIKQVFEYTDTAWRGLGIIPQSGLKIRETFEAFDAQKVFDVRVPQLDEPEGCGCGNVLKGTVLPPDCPLFGNICTPVSPVGPCMVSTEGTCSAYYRYHRNNL